VGALLHSRVKEVHHGIASQGTSTTNNIQYTIVKKNMASVFLDLVGVIHVDSLEHGVQINLQHYSNLLHNDVHQVNQQKRPGNLSKKVTLLHGNVLIFLLYLRQCSYTY
jgi:hypothetical protein